MRRWLKILRRYRQNQAIDPIYPENEWKSPFNHEILEGRWTGTRTDRDRAA